MSKNPKVENQPLSRLDQIVIALLAAVTARDGLSTPDVEADKIKKAIATATQLEAALLDS